MSRRARVKQDEKDRIRKMLEAGVPIVEIVREMGRSIGVVYKIKRQLQAGKAEAVSNVS